MIHLYGDTQHIGKGPPIEQVMDISLLEVALLSCFVGHFLSHSLEFDQAHLYKDVTDDTQEMHMQDFMHQWIEQDMEKYTLRGSKTVAHGKQLFLTVNSSLSSADKRMCTWLYWQGKLFAILRMVD
ncbi:5'-nucleotidase domain-containing protein 2 [Pteropus alecto]|uniref:5'-nucleotidase domain-containing protein 2 n=1 Tax=Pteropus alecto TaxID=9402 RepID=L5KU38_PTEAL|nr:5'-nucleotidase domain-containing protein 2 [Pteropus alecto]